MHRHRSHRRCLRCSDIMQRREIDKNLIWRNVGSIHQVPKNKVTRREEYISYSRAWCLDESHSYHGNTWASPQVTQCKTHFSPPETSWAEKRKQHKTKKNIWASPRGTQYKTHFSIPETSWKHTRRMRACVRKPDFFVFWKWVGKYSEHGVRERATHQNHFAG